MSMEGRRAWADDRSGVGDFLCGGRLLGLHDDVVADERGFEFALLDFPHLHDFGFAGALVELRAEVGGDDANVLACSLEHCFFLSLKRPDAAMGATLSAQAPSCACPDLS